jgi:PAS domain S-box-containing protein
MADQSKSDSAAALRESERRLRLAVEAARIGIWDWNPLTNEMVWSVEAKSIAGLPPDEPVTFDQIQKMTHPQDLPRTSAIVRRALDPKERLREPYEYRIIRRDGEVRWVQAMGEAVFVADEDGVRATRYVGTIRDITDRKRAEERQTFLMRELVHRVRNTLASVRAIATATLRHAQTLKEAETALSARINALADVHSLLSNAEGQRTDMHEIVGAVIAPYRSPQERISIAGPPLVLEEGESVSLAMALHELATNAVKHGALSRPEGRVDLRWTVSDPGPPAKLRLTWREQGGPPTEPANRRGFGMRLIEQALGGDPRSRVEVTFAPEGLTCIVERA